MNVLASFTSDEISLPEVFSGEFLNTREYDILQNKKKLTISGAPNISAKLFLLAKLLQKQPKIQRIVCVFPEKNEMHEAASLAPLFLQKGKTAPTVFHQLSFAEELRQKEKAEWLFLLHQESKNERHVFFMTKEDAQEYFPSEQNFLDERIMLKRGDKISPVTFFQQLIAIGYTPNSDVFLQKGEYRKSGNVIDVFPVGALQPVKIEIGYDSIEDICEFSPENKKIGEHFEALEIFPLTIAPGKKCFSQLLTENDLQVWNELEDLDESVFAEITDSSALRLEFSSFPEEEDASVHLRFLAVLKFYSLLDLLHDFREKLKDGWQLAVLTKRTDELQAILEEEHIAFSKGQNQPKALTLLDAGELEAVPPSFQNQQEKICLFTDREIFHLHGKNARKITSSAAANIEFLTSLKIGDLVVHLDHGIGRFLGICEQEIDKTVREYLEIAYLNNDKLFVPVDQADKVSRFIAEEGQEPKLTRLGGVEWKNVQKRVKKEAEKIAKELLEVYAKRAKAKGFSFPGDTTRQQEFERGFPYEETPGQIAAIRDIKADLESDRPMDRLLCGDVGFGKTEVAMRAAFKVIEAGKQVAFIAPITILADQHYRSFVKRLEGLNVKIEMLSRFRTPAEQKKILHDLKTGKLDIVVGTHRLLSEDVAFHDLGLVIIDEEQRFGVKQKEKFKKIRSEVSILSMSATPIPRTLNLALHKLRDVSTITTPPPGRLPIITEVRKYSDQLIREAILKEKNRQGQVYFLHNRVETIEAMAHKLRGLVPEVTFVVAHGQMKPDDLEDRIIDFKNKKYDVLVSSTIIENGIDLPNANTLIVNNAQDFGLSQLYQLRGRIGRSKTQAYAYLLHSSQKLNINAKKRLKALIEASELGSGFQLSMRDLEIRGAGDVLGVSQHGTINVVGVSHFLRLLQQTIKEMETRGHTGEIVIEEEPDVTMELSLDAYIPGKYIADTKEKILMYQKLASVQTQERLSELEEEMAEEYGKLPEQVKNLFRVLELKLLARKAKLRAIKSVSSFHNGPEIHLMLSKKVTAVEIMNLLKFQTYWRISGESLQAAQKDLGGNWIKTLQEAVRYLESQQKTSKGPKLRTKTEESATSQE